MLMKKSAVAVALMAALGAQAQVTLYGTLDMSLSSVKPVAPAAANAKRNTGIESGGMTASHIGLAGQEDLGDGLKASFQLESIVGADTGSTSAVSFWNRNANIALAAEGLGKLTVGRKQKIFFDSVAAYNPFGEASYGAAMPLLNDLGQIYTSDLLIAAVEVLQGGPLTDAERTQTLALLASEARAWDNSLTYETPNLNGFSGAIQLGLKEASAAGNNVAVSAQYEAGPLSVGFAHQTTKLGLVDAVDLKDTRFVLNGSYDLGVAKLFGQVGKTTWKNTVNGGTVLKVSAFQLGAGVPLSEQGTVLASVGQAKEKENAPETKRTVFSLGYDHTLSKRTDVYGVIKSDKITSLETGNTLAVGVRHRF